MYNVLLLSFAKETYIAVLYDCTFLDVGCKKIYGILHTTVFSCRGTEYSLWCWWWCWCTFILQRKCNCRPGFNLASVINDREKCLGYCSWMWIVYDFGWKLVVIDHDILVKLRWFMLLLLFCGFYCCFVVYIYCCFVVVCGWFWVLVNRVLFLGSLDSSWDSRLVSWVCKGRVAP